MNIGVAIPFNFTGSTFSYGSMSCSDFGTCSCSSSYMDKNVNILTTDEGYEVELSVPGFSKDEISVSVDGKNIAIEAKRNEDNPYRLCPGSFSTKFRLDKRIDANASSIELKDGILLLKLATRSEDKPAKLKFSN